MNQLNTTSLSNGSSNDIISKSYTLSNMGLINTSGAYGGYNPLSIGASPLVVGTTSLPYVWPQNISGMYNWTVPPKQFSSFEMDARPLHKNRKYKTPVCLKKKK